MGVREAYINQLMHLLMYAKELYYDTVGSRLCLV